MHFLRIIKNLPLDLITKKFFVFVVLTAITLFSSALPTLAAYPGTAISPDDNIIDPVAQLGGGCTPGSSNCYVSIQGVEDLLSGVGIIISTSSTSTTISVSTSTLGLETNFFQQNGNAFGALATMGTNDSNGLAFETNNVERLRIDSAGNVGIGTTSPTEVLSIIGNIFVKNSTNGAIVGNGNSGTGTSATIFGLSNTVNSNLAVVFGRSNITTGGGGGITAIGKFNTVEGRNNQAYGSSNIVSNGALAVDAVTIGENIAYGTSNTVSGVRGSAFGIGNEVTDALDYVSAFGTENAISSSTVTSVFGGDNTISNGSNTAAFGFRNDIIGSSTFAFGYNNDIQNGSFALGKLNVTTANNSYLIGDSLTTSQDGIFKLGLSNTAYIQMLSNGNVGIGTTTADRKLSVIGDINFTGSLYQNGVLFSSGTSSQWTTTGSDIYYSTGNVGIGTSTPTTLLSVVGTSTLQNIIPNGPFAGNMSAFDIGASNARWNAMWAGTYNVGTSTFSISSLIPTRLGIFTAASAGGTEALSILDNSNVGIGTTSPSAIFSVSGNSLFDLANVSSGSAAVKIRGKTSNLVTNERLLELQGYSGLGSSAPEFGLYVTGVTTNYFQNNIGVGTTTPANALSVVGDISFTGDLYQNGSLFSGSGTSSQWTTTGSDIYYSTGNVGIGTTNPTFKLSFDNDDSASIGVDPTPAYAAKGGDLSIAAGTGSAGGNGGGTLSLRAGNAFTGTGENAGDIRLYAGGNNFSSGGVMGNIIFYRGDLNGVSHEALRMDSNGNFGIGTTTPGYKLSVAGDINFTGDLYQNGTLVGLGGGSQWTTNGSNIYYNTGNVGIGTTTPEAKLQILSTTEHIRMNYDADNYSFIRVDSSGQTIFNTYGASPLFSFEKDISINGGLSIPVNRSILLDSGEDEFVRIIHDRDNDYGFGSNHTILSTVGGFDFILGSNNSPLLSITSSANVGIGTTTPERSLSIAGSLQLSSTDSLFTAGNRLIVNEGGSGPVTETGFVTQFASGPYGRSIFAITDSGANTAFFGLDDFEFTIGGEGTTDVIFGRGLDYGAADILGSRSESMRIEGDSGYLGIGTTTPGHLITLGGGAYSDGSTWENASDRNLKENFVTLDPQVTLSKIMDLPITQWNYKVRPGRSYIGPVAQDFENIFNLGSDGVSISTIDPAGIALIGIQALNEKIELLQASLNTPSFSLAATSSFDSLTNHDSLMTWLASLTTDMIDGVVGLKNLVVESFTAKHITVEEGVTVKDRVTGALTCLVVSNGQIQTLPRACGEEEVIDNPDTGDQNTDDTNAGNSGTSTDPISGGGSESGTSTDSGVGNASSTPEETGGSSGGDEGGTTPPAEEPTPTTDPVVEPTPEPEPQPEAEVTIQITENPPAESPTPSATE